MGENEDEKKQLTDSERAFLNFYVQLRSIMDDKRLRSIMDATSGADLALAGLPESLIIAQRYFYDFASSIATTRGITTDLTEKLSDKEEIKGQELVEVKAKVETLDKAVASQSKTVEEIKQNYYKLSTLLPLSDLDTEEIVKTVPYILLDQKIKNIETIAKHSEGASKEAKKIANEARETAHNIQRIYILVIVLYAIVLVGLVALGIYVTFFGG